MSYGLGIVIGILLAWTLLVVGFAYAVHFFMKRSRAAFYEKLAQDTKLGELNKRLRDERSLTLDEAAERVRRAR